MEKELTNIEKLRELLKYTRDFEQKVRNLLFPETHNRLGSAIGICVGMAFIQKEMREKKINKRHKTNEASMLREEIESHMRRIQRLIEEAYDLPTSELEEE